MAAMILFSLYFWFSLIVSFARSGPALHILKTNDSDTASPHQFPWLASKQSPTKDGKWRHSCGGSLIAVRDGQTESDIVVSAAHCFLECYSYCLEHGTLEEKQLCINLTHSMHVSIGRERIVLGEHALNDNDTGERTLSLSSLRCHEFNPRIAKNDIAVVKLSSPVTFTEKIRPILLPAQDAARDFSGARGCQVAGWGYMEYVTTPNELRYANVTIFDDDKCSKSWWAYGYDPDLTLCAGLASIGERGGDLHQVACGVIPEVRCRARTKVVQARWLEWPAAVKTRCAKVAVASIRIRIRRWHRTPTGSSRTLMNLRTLSPNKIA